MKKSVILILMFVLIFCSFSVAKYDINIDYQKYLVKEANSEEVIADFLAFKNASKPLYEPKQRGLMALSSSSPPINIQIVIENTLEHHTYKYRPLEVYRRGARLHAKYALYNFDPEKHWFFVGVVGPGGYEFDDEFYEWTCRFSRSREVEECTYDLTIPPDAPVGTYIAYTYVHDIETGDRIFEWEREYYLIFNPFRSGSDVGGLGLSAIKAYAYSPYKGGKDETGIWFSPTIEYKPGILRKWRGADWGRKFALHPYDEDVFKEAISKIRGKTSSKDAAKRLREFTDSHLFSDPKKGQWDTDQLRDSGTHAQCASQANFLVEALRSVGIPSRPVFVDTNYGQSIRLAGEEKAWAFHTWTEIWFTDKWYALDAFISKNKDFYDTQTLGGLDGEDSPYGKQINDLILVAKPDWESSETTYSTDLVDADVQFVYNPEWALFYPYCSVPAQNIDRAGWIEELSQAYWNEPYWTSRECNTPKPYNITVTTDKERYRVGESMIVTVNVSSNLDVASNPLIHGEILEQIPFTKVPIEKTLYSFERSINLLPYGFNQFVEQYDVSEEVVATDFFNIVVNVENVSTITFFDASSLMTLDVETPSVVHQDDTFTTSIEISNDNTITLSDIKASLELPYNLHTDESLVKHISSLLPGQSETLTWSITSISPGDTEMIFNVSSGNGGVDKTSALITVLGYPELLINLSNPSSASVGESFDVNIAVENVGGIVAEGVTVTLGLPSELSTSESLTKNVGDIQGHSSANVAWSIVGGEEGLYYIEVDSSDTTEEYATGTLSPINITSKVGLSPYELKLEALGKLRNMSSSNCDSWFWWFTKDCRNEHRINNAIDYLEMSLSQEYWLGDFDLNPDLGDEVFDYEKQSVEELMKIEE